MLRVIGTVAGGVLGIIVWEITRGNPYGLAVLMFILMIPLYYLFFTNKMLSPLVIMIQVTCILVVCYEYQYVTSGVAVYDSAEVVAGKVSRFQEELDAPLIFCILYMYSVCYWSA